MKSYIGLYLFYKCFSCIVLYVCDVVPDGVSAPTLVVSGPTYLVLQWQLPTSPNGVFTGFTLIQSPGVKLYSGALTSFNVTNLTVSCVV